VEQYQKENKVVSLPDMKKRLTTYYITMRNRINGFNKDPDGWNERGNKQRLPYHRGKVSFRKRG
jgi:hypothetical protein